ncbi:MAG: DUF4350 domain-containing protein [Steroidobacteraceae bacterium]
MRERFITLGCALGALLLFLTMFMHGGTGTERGKDVPRPTTEVRSANGYHAVMEWLDAEHIHTVSLRDRFDKLAGRRDLAASGNILIVTLPATAIFKTEEFRPLDRWLRAGNTLLVLAALSDNPDWAFALGGMAAGDLNLLTGLDFETVRSREQRRRDLARGAPPAQARRDDAGNLAALIAASAHEFDQPRRAALIANRRHAYFTGVREGIALSDYPSQAWTVKVPYEGFVFELAHQRETGEGVLWTRPLGSGRIVVSGFGSIFTNRAIGLADNGRLLANILGANLTADGTVLFDDAHQGLGAAYDPSRFYRDRRLYLTIGILALVWLAWVLGATRLRMPVTRVPVPREAELVRATGGFLARVLTPAAAARRMLDHFLRHWPWELLERHPRIAPADVQQLRSWYTDACGSGRVPLSRLHNLMVRINRQLNS